MRVYIGINDVYMCSAPCVLTISFSRGLQLERRVVEALGGPKF